MTEQAQATGVRNLLENCAGAKPGQSLLIAYETADHGYYSADILTCLTEQAQAFGLDVSLYDVGFDPQTPEMTPALLSRMQSVDIVVFLARLGDQLRFSQMPKGPTIVNAYTLNAHLMRSAFGTAHYDAFVRLKQAVDRCVAEAQDITMTCPAGTDVRGAPNFHGNPQGDTTLKRFPMSVFSPVPAQGFSGRIALSGFLSGTGSRYYPGTTVEFDGPVFALLSQGRLTGFDGNRADVTRADAQYDRVSALFGIDRNFVHSWHAGIHPGCGFPWPVRDSYDRWNGAAFGNPRVMHFHTCGAYAPGEICWNVIDPTITLDGLTLWDKGVCHAERLPDGPDILRTYPCAAAAFAAPDRQIGLPDMA